LFTKPGYEYFRLAKSLYNMHFVKIEQTIKKICIFAKSILMPYYHTRYSLSRKKKKTWKKYILLLLIITLLAAGAAAYYLNQIINSPNTWVHSGSTLIKIPHGTGYQGLLDTLYSKGIIINRKTFERWAKLKKLDENVKPGNYRISSGMSNKELVNLLIAGLQEPVKVTINNVRVKGDLARILGARLEPDSTAFMQALEDEKTAGKYGLTKETFLTLIIPNTYEFYWTTDVEGFFDRMKAEYDKFWTEKRLQQAKEKGLTPVEVSILASIVEQETNKNDEKARIASVYLNRLKRNWRLQADPTVIFALQDFGIRRVLSVHLEVDSPYNTYKYEGLPPGPICLPSIASIDAVLNAEDTDYLFFCAKDDFSGYHSFAATPRQHAANARKYRAALNRRKIMK